MIKLVLLGLAASWCFFVMTNTNAPPTLMVPSGSTAAALAIMQLLTVWRRRQHKRVATKEMQATKKRDAPEAKAKQDSVAQLPAMPERTKHPVADRIWRLRVTPRTIVYLYAYAAQNLIVRKMHVHGRLAKAYGSWIALADLPLDMNVRNKHALFHTTLEEARRMLNENAPRVGVAKESKALTVTPVKAPQREPPMPTPVPMVTEPVAEQVKELRSGKDKVTRGVLAQYGVDRQRRDGRQFQCFFVDVKLTSGELKRLNGVDLERAIADAKVTQGDRVEVEYLGRRLVTVQEKQRGPDGQETAVEKEAKKNLWQIRRLD